tara:strand:- start:354 stop:536 length:183 start_codon:yes stop_codon:yes gene_type:complete
MSKEAKLLNFYINCISECEFYLNNKEDLENSKKKCISKCKELFQKERTILNEKFPEDLYK